MHIFSLTGAPIPSDIAWSPKSHWHLPHAGAYPAGCVVNFKLSCPSGPLIRFGSYYTVLLALLTYCYCSEGSVLTYSHWYHHHTAMLVDLVPPTRGTPFADRST